MSNVDQGRSVVLLSGGMDSSACAVLAVRTSRKLYLSPTVRALLVDYGQPHRDQELYRAAVLANRLGIPHHRIPVSGGFGELRPSRMAKTTHEEAPVSGAHPATIPGRNAILLSLAAAHAAAWFPSGPLLLWIGSCADDAAGFADCRGPFLRAAEECFSRALDRRVSIVAPFLGRTKRELLADAADGDPDMLDAIRDSWSCYRGGERPCGVCTPCRLRADAFEAAGLEDRLPAIAITGGDPHREAR